MTYATGSGTVSQMVASLSTFLKNDGWAPPASLTKNYWRVRGATLDSITNFQVRINSIKFYDEVGASIGTPDTVLAHSNVAGATSAWAAGSPWTVSASSRTGWIGGQWNSAKKVERVEIVFGSVSESWANVTLEWSNDGATWFTQATLAMPSTPQAFDVTWDKNWPLSPNGEIYFSVTHLLAATTGSNITADAIEYFSASSSQSIYDAFVMLSMGKTAMFEHFNHDESTFIRIPAAQVVAEWHFFSDPLTSDYVHVAFRTDYFGKIFWHHLSFGEIDPRGMGHNGVCYATADRMFYYANGNSGGTRYRWNSVGATCPFTGKSLGYVAGETPTVFQFLSGPNYPLPDDGSWPARESRNNASKLAPLCIPSPSASQNADLTPDGDYFAQLGSIGWVAKANPVSGFATLGTLPFIVVAGLDYDDAWAQLGEFPGVRTVRIDNMSAGQEITVGADTWKCFPRLRKQTEAEFAANGTFGAGSGPMGWAYKKVT